MSSIFIKYGIMAQVGEEPSGTPEVRVFGEQGGGFSGNSMWALTFVLDGEDNIVIDPGVTASYDETLDIDISKLTEITLVITDGYTSTCMPGEGNGDGYIKLNGTSLLTSPISCSTGFSGTRTYNITEFEFNEDNSDEIHVFPPGGSFIAN